MKKIIFCIAFLSAACSQVSKKENGANLNDSHSHFDSFNNTKPENFNSDNKNMDSLVDEINPEKYLGNWKIKNFVPLADVFGYTEDDFKKQKGKVSVIITKDSISFLFDLNRVCKYDTYTKKEYSFTEFVNHLGYEGYDKKMENKISTIQVISFKDCLNELYIIGNNFYYETDGVLIEIQKE